MKKIVIILLGVLIFCGCGKPREPLNTITLWHWMTDRDPALQELARRYAKQTGVKVQVELYAPSDTYTQRIIAAAQARVLPDIYGILDKKEIFASFIDNGFVADLSPYFKKDNGAWEKSFFAQALDVNRFPQGNIYKIPPGIYGVPIDVTNIQMLYNKNLLKKAGIARPPLTFDEFMADVAALHRVGVTGFVSGWGEMWMVDCFASNYAFNIMGEEKVMATFRGELAYTSGEWLKVLRVFQTMAAPGVLAEGIVTKTNKDAEQAFALERAAFAFNGYWCVNVYNQMNPKLAYGVMMPPVINSERPMKIWGGAGSSFVVNNHSPNKEQAVAFLKWLTAKEQQTFLSQATLNLPANRAALSDIPPVLADFAKVMDQTTHPTIWPYNEHPLVTEALDRGLQSIVIGEKTPQQVAQEVQAVKVRVMAKKK
ncbi:MAG: extracellular solute-binding protein [Candidatus Omnitrophica bacterium]|nr:extracellular solute-binding protein [Candidatus Omnitrophota bacterium]